MASKWPQTKEEVILKTQQFDLIYVKFKFLYAIILDSPCKDSSQKYVPRESHIMDGVIGNMTPQPNPHVPYPPMVSCYMCRHILNLPCPHQNPVTTLRYNPDLSHASSHLGMTTSYSTIASTLHVHGTSCSGTMFGSASNSFFAPPAMNPYYPFHGPSPSTQVHPHLVATPFS